MGPACLSKDCAFGQRVIFDSPSRRHPTPTSSFAREARYVRVRLGSIPARPGGTSIGTVYSDVPCSVTLKAPFTAPTSVVGRGGKSLIGRVPPSGVETVMGGSVVGGTHCPSPLHEVPDPHEPQL